MLTKNDMTKEEINKAIKNFTDALNTYLETGNFEVDLPASVLSKNTIKQANKQYTFDEVEQDFKSNALCGWIDGYDTSLSDNDLNKLAKMVAKAFIENIGGKNYDHNYMENLQRYYDEQIKLFQKSNPYTKQEEHKQNGIELDANNKIEDDYER